MITILTTNAAHDELSDGDYRDIYAEMREKMSLDRLVVMLDSAYSKAQWSKYEHGTIPLTRTMRQELRRGVGLPQLPPTVAEACAVIDADAEVVRIGDDVVRRAILIGTPTSLSFSVNGSVTLLSQNDGLVARVTGVTRAARKLIRPIATPAQNERRAALGAKWGEVIEAGLATLEKFENGEQR